MWKAHILMEGFGRVNLLIFYEVASDEGSLSVLRLFSEPVLAPFHSFLLLISFDYRPSLSQSLIIGLN